jgi:hypothetical protein
LPPNSVRPVSGGVTRARTFARLLDDLIRIPGTKVGVGHDPVIGLIPGLGDVIGGAMSGYILLVAAKEGVPKSVLTRMLGNIALDSLVGVIPFFGDLFDFGVKANRRNIDLRGGRADHRRRDRRRLLAGANSGARVRRITPTAGPFIRSVAHRVDRP